MATVGDYFSSVLSYFPAFGAQAVNACRERATVKIIESGIDDESKPLRDRCDIILQEWGASGDGLHEATNDVIALLENTESISTEALIMTLTAALATVGYNKFMEPSGDSPFVVLAER